MEYNNLEKYLGKYVLITLLNNELISGKLYKSGSEEFKDIPDLYLPRNYYFTRRADGKNWIMESPLFKSFYVKTLTYRGKEYR